MWLLPDVPSSFSPDQVQELLQQNFEDVELIRQRRRRACHEYLFRGKTTSEHDMLAIPFTVEGESQVQTLWARWAPQKMAIRRPGNLSRPVDPGTCALSAPPFEVEQVPAAPAIPANNPEPGQTGPDAKQTKNGDVAAVGDKAVAPPAAAAADGSQKRACIRIARSPAK